MSTEPTDPPSEPDPPSASGARPDSAAVPADPLAETPAVEMPAPPRPRARSTFGGGWWGWFRGFARLWGFLAFCLLVLVLFRHIIVPFIFAVLLAYILTPLIARMSLRSDGTRRMPRGVAIITVYIVVLACMAFSFVTLLPRVSADIARIGKEAPSLYKKVNEQWAPQAARWLELRFPSLAAPPTVSDAQPAVADVPLPPGTGFVMTPLPDGRYAVELHPSGFEVSPTASGGYAVTPSRGGPSAQRTEDKIRGLAGRALLALQAELDDFFRFGRRLVTGLIQFVFKFFLVLMIAAFIMLDLEKFHSFARSLVPSRYGTDYEIVVAGIDRGLSGVIRGQLIICLLNGALTYAGLLIFSVKYSLVLGILASMLSLIPIFGTILSTLPIMLAAMVSGDSGIDIMRAVFMLAWILGIHFLEANFFNPKILGEAAKIHPVLVIFALIAGEHTYGLVGALLAVPVASIIQVLFVFFRNKAWRPDTSS